MGNIKSASRLNLSNKELTSVPQYVFYLKNLKVLNLSCNNLKDIPIEIANIKFLKYDTPYLLDNYCTKLRYNYDTFLIA